MNVMGIVFANDASLSALTDKRTMASLPFGGRYRLVDFHLSNMAAAGVRHVGIISRHNYQSLVNHIGSGEEWGLTLEEGGLEFLTPYAMSATDGYHGKLEAIHQAMSFLEFGAGTMANSSHPFAQNMQFQVYPGSWSETHSQEFSTNGYWIFGGKKYYFVEPKPGMYEAYKAITQNVYRIAVEVFLE